MQDFAAWIAIYTGAVVGVLKLADWALLARQREWLQTAGKNLWERLEGIRVRDIVAGLGNRRFAYWACFVSHGLFVVIFLAMLLFALLGGAEFEDGDGVYVFASTFAVIAFFAAAAVLLRRPWHVAMRWFASDGRLWLLVLKTFAAFGLLYGFMTFVLFPLFYFLIEQMIVVNGVSVLSWQGVILNVAFIPTYFFMILFLIIWGAMLVFCFLWVALHAFRFVLLRVVEHDKGPVLGLAGLLIAIGAIVKAFQQ
ncbi:hypothetical protein [Nitratireductor sp. XY-223]|uniref:hypothetical protein n=1 Tax=Nitratireductor sp. XY-223 TaxID=2561926 RepID=UPI0010A9DF04|nr:hypothetical protein [Nitratireductor sp. XY-223]